MSDSCSSKRKRDDVADDVSSPAVGLQSTIGKSTIFFGLNFLERDVRLIEVSEDLLKCIDDKEKISIIGPVEMSVKGSPSDAVLTSSQKTYSIKKVETSNAVYIVSPSSSDLYTIQAASQDYYELKPIPARIEKISELLHSSQYNGTDNEAETMDNESRLLSFDELRCQIQASDAEFLASLFSLGVVELRGKMRLLSKAAMTETTKLLIYTIIEQGWDITSIDEEMCSKFIPDTDPVLLNFSLMSLGEKVSSDGTGGGTAGMKLWALNKDTISRATAHNLFKSQSDPSKPWECEDFLRTWDAETPGANAPDQTLLDGIAIRIDSKHHKSLSVNGSTTSSSYRYLPSEELSKTLQVRLEQLFTARQMYTERDLLPYFLDMIGQKGKPASVPELILPHTRLVDDFFMSK